jgi:hypothetical protein
MRSRIKLTKTEPQEAGAVIGGAKGRRKVQIRYLLLGFLLILTSLAIDLHYYNGGIRSVFFKMLSSANSNNSSTNSRSLCEANPYIASLNTSTADIALQAEEWLSNIDGHFAEAQKSEYLSHTHKRFFPFQPMSTCNYTCIGGSCGKDTSKIMCGTEQLSIERKKECIVYSVGGNNQWEFENDILRLTSCHIHTFDCTGNEARFQVPNNDRLTFHHICLGAVSQPAPKNEDCIKGIC